MCGIYNIIYRRYFAVPFVSDEKRKEFLEDVKNTALSLWLNFYLLYSINFLSDLSKNFSKIILLSLFFEVLSKKE